MRDIKSQQNHERSWSRTGTLRINSDVPEQVSQVGLGAVRAPPHVPPLRNQGPADRYHQPWRAKDRSREKTLGPTPRLDPTHHPQEGKHLPRVRFSQVVIPPSLAASLWVPQTRCLYRLLDVLKLFAKFQKLRKHQPLIVRHANLNPPLLFEAGEIEIRERVRLHISITRRPGEIDLNIPLFHLRRKLHQHCTEEKTRSVQFTNDIPVGLVVRE